MAKKIDLNAELRIKTEKQLSKYGTPQLISKLQSGVFLKLSKEVAISILEKRKVDVSEFTDKVKEEKVEEVSVKAKTVEEEDTEKENEEEVQTKVIEKAPKIKTSLAEKVKGLPVKKIVSTFIPMDETLLEVSKIINSAVEMTKTDKIRGLLKLGYSCSQISKSTLNVRYAFCYTVNQKMKELGVSMKVKK